MALGHIEGTIGIGSTGTYEFRRGSEIEIAADANGNYTITYEFWIVFAGQNAYKVYVNGVETFPGAGFLQGSATWVVEGSIEYDCINGQCIAKKQYNTPGLYQSLAECQSVCTNGGACASGKQCVDPSTFCPDGKVCIDQGEFASIEALISKIGSEVC